MSQFDLVRKVGLFHWNIGFIEQNIQYVMENPSDAWNIAWMRHAYKDRFFADPFLLNYDNALIEVLVEEFI
jgi:hypothetical protein